MVSISLPTYKPKSEISYLFCQTLETYKLGTYKSLACHFFVQKVLTYKSLQPKQRGLVNKSLNKLGDLLEPNRFLLYGLMANC